MKFNLHSAAKARGKTISEYVGKSDWTRWVQIHEELAFDKAESMLQTVSFGLSKEKSEREGKAEK